MTPDAKLEKLRQSLISAVDDLKATEATLLQAQAAANFARSNAAAGEMIRSKVELEAATERVLEAASEAEAALAKYRQASNDWYGSSIQKATEATRGLHAERVKIEEQIAALNLQIEIASEKEQPEVDRIVEESDFHSTCASGMAGVVTSTVRLASQQAMVA